MTPNHLRRAIRIEEKSLDELRQAGDHKRAHSKANELQRLQCELDLMTRGYPSVVVITGDGDNFPGMVDV